MANQTVWSLLGSHQRSNSEPDRGFVSRSLWPSPPVGVMAKKRVGILKRNAYTNKPAGEGKCRKKRPLQLAANALTKETPPAVPEPILRSKQTQQQRQEQRFWTCQSEVDRQAAACLSKILSSDASKRNGRAIKSLTLAPHIKAKKAVYAVTCQTLQCKSPQSCLRGTFAKPRTSAN